MTNNHTTKEDFLDILFRNRNKAYGAYAVRKTYPHRLQTSLGFSLGFCGLLFFISLLKSKPETEGLLKKDDLVNIRTVVMPVDKKYKDEKVIKKSETRQIKNTAIIKIEKDDLVKITEVPQQSDIEKGQTSNVNTSGKDDDGTTTINTGIENNGITNATIIDKPEGPAVVSYSAAKFLGGNDAFSEFLKKYLVTPGELEAGETRKVIVRLKVDVDGTISNAEILQSGGQRFDKEVLRVHRKMPRWIPAQQNGVTVASYFVQPVTFVAIEE